ncbi:hypothetical protein Glove_114g97 [Diversispora epigaea]|uniref:Uncharacterized protein n=1 Tax=Diversispora epigaea TaxID=1348612 RepID=A0A397J5N0_9GLOM|nr:hypothetical protein Glove_114g97 [Diversispora epigaea]
MSEKIPHKYFEHDSSEWSISGYLRKCELENYEYKMGYMLDVSNGIGTIGSIETVNKIVAGTKRDIPVSDNQDDDKVPKRTKIDQYFPIFLVYAVTPTPLNKDEHNADFDVKQDVDNIYYEELSSVETSLNSAIQRLANNKNSIARYQILFLPEDNIISKFF